MCEKMFSYLIQFSLALGGLSLCACAHVGSKEFTQASLQLPAILEQVNQAIQIAKSESSTQLAAGAADSIPEITSVELNLQVGTTRSASGQFPLSFVIPELSANKGNVHKISLTFVPKPILAPVSEEKTADAGLVAAIGTIYRAVANSNPDYQFQKGSVELDCTLQLGLGASTPGAQSQIKIVPIEIDANLSSQSTQTITLVFGPSTGVKGVGTASIAAPHLGSSPAPAPALAPSSSPKANSKSTPPLIQEMDKD